MFDVWTCCAMSLIPPWPILKSQRQRVQCAHESLLLDFVTAGNLICYLVRYFCITCGRFGFDSQPVLLSESDMFMPVYSHSNCKQHAVLTALVYSSVTGQLFWLQPMACSDYRLGRTVCRQAMVRQQCAKWNKWEMWTAIVADDHLLALHINVKKQDFVYPARYGWKRHKKRENCAKNKIVASLHLLMNYIQLHIHWRHQDFFSGG